MGYVTESRGGNTFPTYPWNYASSDGVTRHSSLSGTRVLKQSQYGYRSGQGSNPDYEPPDSVLEGGTYAKVMSDTMSKLRLEHATTPSPLVRTPSRPVHSRRYSEVRSIPTEHRLGTWYSATSNHWSDMLVLCYPTAIPQPIPQPTDAVISAASRQVWFRLRGSAPTRPDMSLAQFVLELGDLGRLLSTFAAVSRYEANIGGAHLAHEFGIKPIISDIRGIANAVVSSEKVLTQFARDAARLVKRNTSLEASTSTTTGTIAESNWIKTSVEKSSPLSALVYGSHYTTTVKTTVRGGCLFEYFVGDPDSVVRRNPSFVEKAERLLGTNITPSVVYELTPWSWMVDWFVGIGGLLQYQQQVADHHLAARRSFVVHETTSETTYSGLVRFTRGNEIVGERIVDHSVTSRTQNRSSFATPFGPDTSWDRLNGFQLSILGALGLQKRT